MTSGGSAPLVVVRGAIGANAARAEGVSSIGICRDVRSAWATVATEIATRFCNCDVAVNGTMGCILGVGNGDCKVPATAVGVAIRIRVVVTAADGCRASRAAGVAYFVAMGVGDGGSDVTEE